MSSVKIVVTALPLEEYTDAQLRNFIEKRAKMIASGKDGAGEPLTEDRESYFKDSLAKAKRLLAERNSRFEN